MREPRLVTAHQSTHHESTIHESPLMQRNTIFLLLLLLVGGAAFYLYQKKGNKTGTHIAPDMDFTIRDTAAITKLFLVDRQGHKILLERQKDHWLVDGKFKVRPSAINVLFDCFTKQQVQYVPPESAKKVMIANLSSLGIKTEVYMNGSQKPSKVFYVGDVTPDEIGTHMMMEGADQPYVVHIPSFVGAVRGRYMLQLEDWKDRRIFAEDPSQIQSISVEYPMQKSASFIIERQNGNFEVKPFFATQQVYPASKLRKGMAESYAIQFRKLTAEAFETYNPKRDSVRALLPFCLVKLTKTDGEQKLVKFHPVKVEKHAETGQPFVFRYFADCSWGDFMLAQHTVFGDIFRGYDFFFDVAPQGNGQLLR
jgi:Domain of unknown function (DUF4340)